MGSAYRLVRSVIVRDMPDETATPLVQAPRNLIVERQDTIFWSGYWIRIVADVAGAGLYEGYVPAEDALEDDGDPLHDETGPAQTHEPAPPIHEDADVDDRSLEPPPTPPVCITDADYFHDNEGYRRTYLAELDDAKIGDARAVVDRINALMARASADGIVFHRRPKTGSAVSSGWRPVAVNERTRGAAKKSNHIVCRACDLYDPHGAIDRWCLDNPAILAEIGLWQEDPWYTPNWCHLQIIEPNSKKRVFQPYAGSPNPADPAFAPSSRTDPNIA